MPASKQRTTIWLITVLCFLLLGLWTAAASRAECTWVTTLVAYMPQQLFAIMPALLLLWAVILKDWRTARWNVAALAYVLVILMQFNIPMHALMPARDGRPIRIMTLNMHHAHGGIARIVELVEQENPDVICFQEANTGNWRSEVPSELVDALSRYEVAKFRELATFSRYPIVGVGVHRMQERTGRAILETVLDVNGRGLTVMNVHLSTATEGSLFHRKGSLAHYVHGAVNVRRDQVAKVLDLLSNGRTNVVVAGDFNTPPRGVFYDWMTEDLADAFQRKGFGYGYTYRSSQPLMRIDYVFVGTGLDVQSIHVPKRSPSDHRPVVADLVILEPEGK